MPVPKPDVFLFSSFHFTVSIAVAFFLSFLCAYVMTGWLAGWLTWELGVYPPIDDRNFDLQGIVIAVYRVPLFFP
jgi:hypothetical protein